MNTRMDTIVAAAVGNALAERPADHAEADGEDRTAFDLAGYVALVHARAEAADVDSKLILAAYGEDPDSGRSLPPIVEHFAPGDVHGMSRRARELTVQPHRNVYAPLALMRSDLGDGKKGGEGDITAVLGFVADFDDDDAARWRERLPVAPSFTLETSPGRFQAFLLFDTPLSPKDAKPLAQALQAHAKCDHGTADLSHVWRFPETLNWPNKKKIDAGRPREPFTVRTAEPFNGRLIPVGELRDALPKHADTNSSATSMSAKQKAELVGLPNETPAPLDEVAVRRLCKIDEAFRRTWKRDRDDLEDTSASGWDLQLAICARRLDIPAGDAWALLIAYRFEHGEDADKAHQAGYAARTLFAAGYVDPKAEFPPITDEETLRASTTKPTITVRAGELVKILRQSVGALQQARVPIYRRGQVLVRTARAAEIAPRGVERPDEAIVLTPIEAKWLTVRLAEAAHWQKYDARKKGLRAIDPPSNIGADILSVADDFKFPHLRAIARHPVVRPDGTLITQPEYHADFGLLLDFDESEFGEIPAAPSRDDARRALGRLEHLLRNFPFVDEASKAVAVSAILTAIMRPMLDTAPLHAFDAPTAGSGKSLLCHAVSVIATGRTAPMASAGSNDEELEKRLNAGLLAGDQVFVLDNVERPIGGDRICQMLTEPAVQVRILGRSEQVTIPCTAFLLCTGNNLRLRGDLTRRAILGRIDPKHERPDLRNIDQDLKAEALGQRANLVCDALTVVAAYARAGRPGAAAPLGSFVQWSRTVRDALVWAGMPDIVSTMDKLRAEDPELDALRSMLHACAQKFGTSSFQARDIEQAARSSEDFHQELGEAVSLALGSSQSATSRTIGEYMRAKKERVVDGLAFIKVGEDRNGVAQWMVHGAAAAENSDIFS